jgi:voltage-gated potassium channel
MVRRIERATELPLVPLVLLAFLMFPAAAGSFLWTPSAG